MSESTWAVDAMEAALDLGVFPAAPPVIYAYKTGTTSRPDIAWTEADLAGFPHSRVIRIHQGLGTQDPLRTADGVFWDEADLEAGAWDVPGLVDAIKQRNRVHWSTRVYASDTPFWELVAAAVAAGVSLRSVFWREANWSLSELAARARLGGQRYAVQWASPSSKPDAFVPGTSLTLRQAGLDLNVHGLVSTTWRG